MKEHLHVLLKYFRELGVIAIQIVTQSILICEFTGDFALRTLCFYWTEEFLSAKGHRKLNKFSLLIMWSVRSVVLILTYTS